MSSPLAVVGCNLKQITNVHDRDADDGFRGVWSDFLEDERSGAFAQCIDK